MEKLAKSRTPEVLAKQGFKLYEAFRPEIPAGESGWGAKGALSLKKIEQLVRTN
jgi:hypothetical protein